VLPVTPHAIANEVRMKRSQFAGSFIIVEGDSDARVYKRLVDLEACRVINGQNRDNVVRAMQILDDDGFEGVLGIVDADYSVLDEVDDPNANILRTDEHDLELMLIRSPALDKLIAELGSPGKIEALEANLNTDIRSLLLSQAEVVGYLRWMAGRERLDLRFDGLDFGRFVDKSTMRVTEERLVREVRNHSGRLDLRVDEMIAKVNELRKLEVDVWQVCCGHDVVEILSVGLRRLLGTHNSSEVQPVFLEKSLRLAYEESYFSDTGLRRRIHDWEQRTARFRVLRP
jgi:Protein of unknown function (DUF4435)